MKNYFQKLIGFLFLNLRFFILMSLCFYHGTLQAYSFTLKAHEWITWPEYCKSRYVETNIGLGSEYVNQVPLELRAKWRNALGGGFHHIHHYCAGLVWIARARGTLDARQREIALGQAISEISYTFARVHSDFPLYSDMAAYLAQAYFEMGNNEKATNILKEAVSKAPEKLPAYIMSAEIFMKSGRNQEALDMLLQGQRKANTESAELHYFLGHVYLRLNNFEKAKKHGKRAYELGYPLPGLKRMLQSKNLWK